MRRAFVVHSFLILTFFSIIIISISDNLLNYERFHIKQFSEKLQLDCNIPNLIKTTRANKTSITINKKILSIAYDRGYINSK